MNKRMKKKNKTTIGDTLSAAMIAAGCAMQKLGNNLLGKKMICKNRNRKGYYIKKLWKE